MISEKPKGVPDIRTMFGGKTTSKKGLGDVTNKQPTRPASAAAGKPGGNSSSTQRTIVGGVLGKQSNSSTSNLVQRTMSGGVLSKPSGATSSTKPNSGSTTVPKNKTQVFGGDPNLPVCDVPKQFSGNQGKPESGNSSVTPSANSGANSGKSWWADPSSKTTIKPNIKTISSVEIIDDSNKNSFTGQGYSLAGGSTTSKSEVIVRRIPGIGVIRSERPRSNPDGMSRKKDDSTERKENSLNPSPLNLISDTESEGSHPSTISVGESSSQESIVSVSSKPSMNEIAVLKNNNPARKNLPLVNDSENSSSPVVIDSKGPSNDNSRRIGVNVQSGGSGSYLPGMSSVKNTTTPNREAVSLSSTPSPSLAALTAGRPSLKDMMAQRNRRFSDAGTTSDSSVSPAAGRKSPAVTGGFKPFSPMRGANSSSDESPTFSSPSPSVHDSPKPGTSSQNGPVPRKSGSVSNNSTTSTVTKSSSGTDFKSTANNDITKGKAKQKTNKRRSLPYQTSDDEDNSELFDLSNSSVQEKDIPDSPAPKKTPKQRRLSFPSVCSLPISENPRRIFGPEAKKQAAKMTPKSDNIWKDRSMVSLSANRNSRGLSLGDDSDNESSGDENEKQALSDYMKKKENSSPVGVGAFNRNLNFDSDSESSSKSGVAIKTKRVTAPIQSDSSCSELDELMAKWNAKPAESSGQNSTKRPLSTSSGSDSDFQVKRPRPDSGYMPPSLKSPPPVPRLVLPKPSTSSISDSGSQSLQPIPIRSSPDNLGTHPPTSIQSTQGSSTRPVLRLTPSSITPGPSSSLAVTSRPTSSQSMNSTSQDHVSPLPQPDVIFIPPSYAGGATAADGNDPNDPLQDCPVCNKKVKSSIMNDHLDLCLALPYLH